jgi:hypothetical protein
MKTLYKCTVVLWTEYDPSNVDPQLMDLRFHDEYEYVHVFQDEVHPHLRA